MQCLLLFSFRYSNYISEICCRRSVIIILIVVVLANCIDGGEIENCKCFEEFEPRKEDDHWLCRGTKNFRIFGCGEEKPPLCVCYKKGKEVILDIGETSCFSLDTTFDDINCSPKDQWNTYLDKNPHRRIYH